MKIFTRSLVSSLLLAVAACDAPSTTAPPPPAAPDDVVSQEVAGQIPGRDLRERPPAVEELQVSATVDETGRPAGRLEVRYGEPLPPQIKLLYEGQPLLLRDDGRSPDRIAGDGLYSALVAANEVDPHGSEVAVLASAATVKDGPTIKERSLLVSDVRVVNHPKYTADPCLSVSQNDAKKEWTMGYLLTQAANQSAGNGNPTPSDFATAWMESWASEAIVNGDHVVPLDTSSTRQVAAEALRQWRCASGIGACCVHEGEQFFHEPTRIAECQAAASEKDASGKTRRPLKMNKAPFRLAAIVNRTDLRHNLNFGAGKAGELRFVFGVLDLEQLETRSGACTAVDMIRHDRGPLPPALDVGPGSKEGSSTVILEYVVNKKTSTDVKNWGKSWWNLKDLDPHATGTHKDDYVNNLHDITKTIVAAGKGSGGNGSALLRIRTNESTDDNTWQLREFAIPPKGHLPAPHTIANTPNRGFNEDSLTQDRLLGPWIDANVKAILNQQHKVPDTFPGDPNLPFVGGETTHLEAAGRWGLNVDDGTLICNNPEARRMFSLNTCTGCHGAETNTPFAHIVARNYLEPSPLSSFLTGEDDFGGPFTVKDPITGLQNPFHELDDRLKDLAKLVGGTVLSTMAFQPTTRVH
jgi:hypothetical protein